METNRLYDAVNVILSLQVRNDKESSSSPFCLLIIIFGLFSLQSNCFSTQSSLWISKLFVISKQSRNGGFPAWEPQRAFSWLEVTYDALACHCYLISLY